MLNAVEQAIDRVVEILINVDNITGPSRTVFYSGIPIYHLIVQKNLIDDLHKPVGI